MGVDGERFIGNPNRIEFTDDELDLEQNVDEIGNFGVLFAEETEDVEEEEENYDFDYDYDDFSLDEVITVEDEDEDDDDDEELRLILINGTYMQVNDIGRNRENFEPAAAASSDSPEQVVNDIDNNEIVKSSETGSPNDTGGNDTQPLPPEGTV